MTASLPEPVVVTQEFPVAPHILWAAITQVDQMKQWYFAELVEFEPKVGFATQFTVECDGREFRHRWTVTKVEDGKMISYAWDYEGIPGKSEVHWRLDEAAEGTRLELTHQETEAFPPEDPLFTRESCLAGWEFFLADTLPEYLEQLG